jgi:DNA-binding CsgD family transcriptional regulator
MIMKNTTVTSLHSWLNKPRDYNTLEQILEPGCMDENTVIGLAKFCAARSMHKYEEIFENDIRVRYAYEIARDVISGKTHKDLVADRLQYALNIVSDAASNAYLKYGATNGAAFAAYSVQYLIRALMEDCSEQKHYHATRAILNSAWSRVHEFGCNPVVSGRIIDIEARAVLAHLESIIAKNDSNNHGINMENVDK